MYITLAYVNHNETLTFLPNLVVGRKHHNSLIYENIPNMRGQINGFWTLRFARGLLRSVFVESVRKYNFLQVLHEKSTYDSGSPLQCAEFLH